MRWADWRDEQDVSVQRQQEQWRGWGLVPLTAEEWARIDRVRAIWREQRERWLLAQVVGALDLDAIEELERTPAPLADQGG